jgi:hypothetical protein
MSVDLFSDLNATHGHEEKLRATALAKPLYVCAQKLINLRDGAVFFHTAAPVDLRPIYPLSPRSLMRRRTNVRHVPVAPRTR